MILVEKLLEKIKSGYLLGTPYGTLDCQAYVEKVMTFFGPFPNYRGSNHMWREAVNSKQKIKGWEDIPAGVAVFTVATDGGEIARGYHDDQGNAKHVGFYAGDGMCYHSTTGGVQKSTCNNTSFTHWAYWNNVSYHSNTPGVTEDTTLTLTVKELHLKAIDWLIQLLVEERDSQ